MPSVAAGDHLASRGRMNLRMRVLSGIRWTAGETVLNALLGLASTAVLARLLQPHDFGLMAIVTVVLAFAQVFADLGVSQAIIQRPDIRADDLDTLYWANVLAGVAVFSALVLAAVPLARFYGDPRLAPLVMVAGVSVVLQAAGQQFSILLRKDLQFERVARTAITGRFAGVVAAVVAAFAGFGVWALVFSSLASAATTSALYARAGWALHRPRLAFRPARFRSFLRFGAYQMGEGVVHHLVANLDTLLLGRLLGSQALGLYAVAKQLVLYPAQMVRPILLRMAFPVMARAQDDLPRLRAMYLQAVNHLSSLNFPFYAGVFVFAPEITVVLVGPQWLPGAPLVRILAVYGALRSLAGPLGSLVLARGRVRRAFWWNLASLVLLPLALLAGARGGATGVAWALVALQLGLLLPAWKMLVQPLCGASFREYHLQLLRASLPAVAGALAGYAAADLASGTLARLAIGATAGALATLGAHRAINPGFLHSLRAMALPQRP